MTSNSDVDLYALPSPPFEVPFLNGATTAPRRRFVDEARELWLDRLGGRDVVLMEVLEHTRYRSAIGPFVALLPKADGRRLDLPPSRKH